MTQAPSKQEFNIKNKQPNLSKKNAWWQKPIVLKAVKSCMLPKKQKVV